MSARGAAAAGGRKERLGSDVLSLQSRAASVSMDKGSTGWEVHV
jgi:hypothetical protein